MNSNLNKLLPVILFLLFLVTSFRDAKAVGVGAEINLDVIDNIFVPKKLLVLEDNIFIGATAFANYYDAQKINYNYGIAGKLGYKIANASVYGLAGMHNVDFTNNQKQNFKGNFPSPIYGFGVGYDLPLINLGFRLENNFFSLDRKDNGKENFNFIDFRIVLSF